MAIIKKVKDWLGIEGVKIGLALPETFKIKEGLITGSYSVSSQSEQYIESIRIILKEKYIRGRRKSKLIDEYVLVEDVVSINEPIAKDEVITKEFTLEFSELKSAVDKLGDKNILYRGITSIAKMLKNAKSEYSVTAEVSVKGNKLKPYDTVIIVAD